MTDTARIDQAGPVRPGEALAIDAVDTWLRTQVPDLEGQPEVTQYTGGASNWTYRLRYPSHDLILRRPPAGTKAASAHDMGREYRVQQALRGIVPVPRMVAFCDDDTVIGCPFYVMERLEGVILRGPRPSAVQCSPDQARQLCLNAIEHLVALHTLDIDAAGLRWLGRGSGYVRRQIEGWAERYTRARTWNVPRFHGVIRWLRDNLPAESAIRLVHNDYRLDNLVLDPDDPTRIIGILDWEMATLGDPLMDLGNMLAYWAQADDDPVARGIARQPSMWPGMLTREEIVAAWFERSGFSPGPFTFYEVYGLFRLAGIVQQIYYRYHHRQTRNRAFRHYWLFVHYLHHRCRKLIRQSLRNGRSQ